MARNDDSDFEDVSWDIDGWFKADEGLKLEGELVHFRTITTEYGPNLVYVFKLTKPCMAKPSGDDDAESEEFPADSVIAVFSSGGLQGMQEVRVGTVVRLTVTGQKKVKRGMMWCYRIQASKRRGTGPFPRLVEPEPERRRNTRRHVRRDDNGGFEDVPSDGEDIPF